MRLPPEEKLSYIKLLAEVLLLVLLVPLAAYAVFRSPRHAADKAVGRAI